MALTTLRYLQDDDDPLNQLLAGGGEPAVPDAPPQPAQQDAPPEQSPDQSLEQSLLDQNQPPPAAAAPERVYSEPDPVKMRDTYAQPSAAGASKDPELDAAFRQAQLDGLQHGGFDDGKYGVGEAVRDNGAALLASILDIGFNKGRGLGGIVGATANEVGKQEAARAGQRKDARDFALKAREKGDGALQQQRMDYLLASLAEREKAHGDVNDRFGKTQAARLPDSAIYQADVAKTGLKAGAGATGRLNAEHALVDQTAGDRSQIAGAESAATTGARIGTEHENAPITQQDAANLAAAQTAARTETELGYAPQTNAAAAQRAGGEASARVEGERAAQSANRPTPPGFQVANQAVFDNANQDPGVRSKMLQDTMSMRQLQGAADRIAALREQNGPQWTPNANSGEYQALHLAVIGAANRAIADAGTLNAGERQTIESLVPGAKPDWKDLGGWLAGQDFNAQQLEGFAKGLNQVIASRVASYGLAPGEAAPPPAAAAPQMGQPPANRMPGYGHDLSTEHLGARQALPQKPAGANYSPPPAAGVHHIRNPRTGEVVKTMMDPEQLKPALAAGWQVVD